MKKLLIFVLVLLPFMTSAQVSVSDLRVNHLAEPMGIDPSEAPTLSWILSSPVKNTLQTAYEVTVTSGGRKVWSSGKVESDNSTCVKYEGGMQPDTRYEWNVRVWDNHGKVSKRAGSYWHTGLRTEDWKAQWISQPFVEDNRPVYFRAERTLDKKIRRATAYITSHGIYEAFINGKRVGDAYLTPGWTSYHERLQYQAYDVTGLLRQGKNAVGVGVAPGWYAGGLGWGKVENRYHYGKDLSLLLQINIEYADGTRGYIMTDGNWCQSLDNDGKNLFTAGEGTEFANIYDGQTIDARKRNHLLWATIEPEDLWCVPAVVADLPKDNIVATVNEPVVKHASLPAVKYFVTPKGEKVIDFGQNIVGWERAVLRGKSGDVVRIKHAEVLDKDGNFYTANLRQAKATSTYILKGSGEEVFEPTMTFYGFRYIMVEGIEGDLNPADFTAEVIYSDFDTVGEFSSSNPTINQLQSNIEWGFHDNFVDVPTDCPQRDERMGWTGDAQVFFRTATFLGRVDGFFRKWLADLAADQRGCGAIPRVIPDVFPDSDSRIGATGWADAATIIPWDHYMAYGDISVLADQYESMRSWVDYMVNMSRDNNYLWNMHNEHFGDWLFWSKPDDPDGQSAVTSKHLVAQCFFANSADIVSRSATLLGKEDDARYYADVAAKVREAYLNEYVTPNGLISSDTQTAYVLALHFNMIPEQLRAQAVERLADNVARYKDHITTGFLGTPYICNVLTDGGRSDVAYRLLLQKTAPSWIYPVSKGATTIWERWDSIRPDGSIIKGMNSFNHYSFGAIGDWLYRSAVGIRESSPGYKSIVIRPHTGGDFEWMQAATETPYGRVAAKWTAEDNVLKTLEVTVPVNTTAEIYLPVGEDKSVFVEDLEPAGYEDGYLKFNTGSGDYRFVVLN